MSLLLHFIDYTQVIYPLRCKGEWASRWKQWQLTLLGESISLSLGEHMCTNWSLHFYHSYTRSNPLPHPWQTPLKWRHWKWGFEMNVKARKLAFCLSRSYTAQCTVCESVSSLPHLTSLLSCIWLHLSLTALTLRSLYVPGPDQEAPWKPPFLVNSIVSWVLLVICREMGTEKFTSSHVFPLIKKALHNYNAMEYLLKITSVEYLKISTRIFWMNF